MHEEKKSFSKKTHVSKIEEQNESSVNTDWNEDILFLRDEALDQYPPNFELAKIHGEASKVK